MNREIILPMNEITDSVEMLHEKPNRGMPVFTWIIAFLLIVVMVWCYIGEIDYYIKAIGVVRPGESISTISSLMTGRIDTMNISEGDYVEKGDLLFKIDTSELEQSLTAYEKEKQRIETENLYLEKLKESITKDKNLLDESNADEFAYYLKYEKYVSDLQTLAEQYKNTVVDTDKAVDSAVISSESIRAQLVKYKDELEGLKMLKSSVDSGKNKFSDKSGVYALQFLDYNAALTVYDSNILQAEFEKEKAKTLYSIGGISQSEHNNVIRSYENAKIEKEKYISEFKLNIEQSISNAERNISELEYSLKTQNQNYSAYSEISHDMELAINNMRLEMLTGIADSISANEKNIISIDKQIADIKLSISNAEIRAPIDGTVNLYSDLSCSDLIQSGQTVATIVPNTDGAYKITMYLSSSDISETEIGQKVKLRFPAYPYQEYGEFLGTVKKISTDVRSSEDDELLVKDEPSVHLILASRTIFQFLDC